MTIKTSVLMSVYHRVQLAELQQSLASIKWQTTPADQIVIVIDGPIPTALAQLLNDFANQPDITSEVELVHLEKNSGLTHALNEGLKHCRGDWIFRMDADDLSLPNRFASQLDFIQHHPEVDVLGTALYEFSTDPRRPQRIKPVTEDHDEIAAGFALRNPMNHPTVCLRKSLVQAQGGYPELPLLEDYYLWAKLLEAGARFHNLPVPLYSFRFDANTLERRRGISNFKNETWLRRWMYQRGLITRTGYYAAVVIQVVLRFVPRVLQDWLWQQSRSNSDVHLELPATDQVFPSN